MANDYLLNLSLPLSDDHPSIQAALQERYLELKGLGRYRPLRDLVGPVLQIQEIEKRALGGTDHVQLVANHPNFGTVTVLFREEVMKGAALLVPGAQVRFSAYPTVRGLGFRATDAARASAHYLS